MRPEDSGKVNHDKYSFAGIRNSNGAHGAVSHLEFLPDVQEEIDG
jgi:hypothetical protein